MFEAKNHVTRLSRYKAIIKRLKGFGMSKIFAENLAEASGVTAALVRKDFSLFGITGNKKAGYQADQLISEIDRLLGKEKEHEIVLVGHGNFGRALVNHAGFEKEGIRIGAVFESDERKLDLESVPPIYSVDGMENYIEKNDIKIAALTVADHAAQGVVDRLVKSGIEGILNFSSMPIRTPPDVFVNNIDIEMALETIIFYTHSPVKEKG